MSASAEAALVAFVDSPTKVVTPELRGIMENIAQTGTTELPWDPLSKFLAFQLQTVLSEAARSFQDCPETGEESLATSQERMTTLLLAFEGPPFTIQRFCELLLNPVRHYHSTRKLVCALDKVRALRTYLHHGCSFSPSALLSPTKTAKLRILVRLVGVSRWMSWQPGDLTT